MKPLLLTLALLACAAHGFAQKFAVKDNLVMVDGQPYFQFDTDGYDLLYVNSLQGERLLVVKETLLNDPLLCTPDNLTGSRWYLQFFFAQPRTMVETARPATLTSLPVIVARKLYAAHLLRQGTVSPAALTEFSFVNGTVYSDRRQALNQAGWLPPAAPSPPATTLPQSPRTPRP